MSATENVYVVRDASGEYIRDLNGGRTPVSGEALEFETIGEAIAACSRMSDDVRIRTRQIA